MPRVIVKLSDLLGGIDPEPIYRRSLPRCSDLVDMRCGNPMEKIDINSEFTESGYNATYVRFVRLEDSLFFVCTEDGWRFDPIIRPSVPEPL